MENENHNFISITIIQNSNVIFGGVHQPENLQIGDNTRIQKYSMIKKIGIIGAIAAMLTILHYLGLLHR
ncbi:MAG: hypothetical protein NTW93_00665 [Phycisphaerae bacterium]|nr:hypothetical protein [Phycisphaerae bacterium]